jgi:hypothetical protein
MDTVRGGLHPPASSDAWYGHLRNGTFDFTLDTVFDYAVFDANGCEKREKVPIIALSALNLALKDFPDCVCDACNIPVAACFEQFRQRFFVCPLWTRLFDAVLRVYIQCPEACKGAGIQFRAERGEIQIYLLAHVYLLEIFGSIA